MAQRRSDPSAIDFRAVSERVIGERRDSIRRRKCTACGNPAIATAVRTTLEAWADGRITRPFTWPDFVLVVQEVFRDLTKDPRANLPSRNPRDWLYKHCVMHEPEELVNAARR